MNIAKTVKILESLAQKTRLKAFKILVKAGLDGMPAGEIGDKIGVAQNNMSFHLSHLENSGLIKSKKDGRYIIYSADFKVVENLMKYLLESCCFDSDDKCHVTTNFSHLFEGEKMKKIKTLILCTGNSCRSILFEALLNHYASDKFIACSAGSNPTGQVNPFSIRTLEKHNIPTSSPRSKSWDEFKDTKFDLIITVCGGAANESCPAFLGKGAKIYLGFDDPAKFIGSNAQTQLEFDKCFNGIKDLVLKISSIDTSNKSIAQISKKITSLYNN